MNKWGIKKQTLILALLPAIIIATSLAAYFIYSQISLVNSTLIEKGLLTTRHIADESQYGIFSGNHKSLKDYIDKTSHTDNTESISILDKEKNILVHTGNILDKDVIVKRLNDKLNHFYYTPNNSIIFISPINPQYVDLQDFYIAGVQEDLGPMGWAVIETIIR